MCIWNGKISVRGMDFGLHYIHYEKRSQQCSKSILYNHKAIITATARHGSAHLVLFHYDSMPWFTWHFSQLIFIIPPFYNKILRCFVTVCVLVNSLGHDCKSIKASKHLIFFQVQWLVPVFYNALFYTIISVRPHNLVANCNIVCYLIFI